MTAPLKQTDRNLVLKCGFSSKLAKEGTGGAERGKEERREVSSLGVYCVNDPRY